MQSTGAFFLHRSAAAQPTYPFRGRRTEEPDPVVAVTTFEDDGSLEVAATGGSNPTATAAAQTGVNKVEFAFTVPSRTHTLSLSAQTISGTIVDAAGGAASDKAFAAGDVIDAGGAGDGGTETISVA